MLFTDAAALPLRSVGSVHLFLETAGLTLCLLGIMMTAVQRKTIEKRSKRYFRFFFSLLIVDLLAYALADLVLPSQDTREWIYYATITHMLLSPTLAYVVSFFLLDTVDPRRKRRRLRRNLFILLLIHVYLLFIMQARRLYVLCDAEGALHRGSLYMLYVMQSVLPLLMDFTILLHEKKRLRHWETTAFWFYCALPAAGFVASMYVDPHIILYSVTVAALIMFLLILVEQTERYRRKAIEAMRMRLAAAEKEKESTEMRMSLMLSQIQPHFLYNSLSVIQNLCHGAAPEAEAATARFSRYLRHNMSSMTNSSLIPFTEELSHAKNYLELERLRFGEQLQIRFDTPVTRFYLPPLTLQPIVENAVRHGVRMRPDGRGTVAVATMEFPDRFEIFVLDNGRGFDTTKPPNDGQLHVGIQNVRDRLEKMCGGKLELFSRVGVGTTAVIVLPKDMQGG